MVGWSTPGQHRGGKSGPGWLASALGRRLRPRRADSLSREPRDRAAVISPLDPGFKFHDAQLRVLLAGIGQQGADTADVGLVGGLRLVGGPGLSHQFVKHVVHAPTIRATAAKSKVSRMSSVTIGIATGIIITRMRDIVRLRMT